VVQIYFAGFDPGDGKVMVAGDGSENSPDPLNERLVASRLDGVVGNEVDAPPDHRRGEPVHVPHPLESVVC